jgi:hypothetical protein
MVTRNQIVDAARSCVGLPYNEKLPSKGLLLAVGERLGLPHQDVSALRGKFKHEIKPGDIVVLRVSATTCQNAILTEYKGELCVVRPVNGYVAEHRLDRRWRDRILQAFELPGLE